MMRSNDFEADIAYDAKKEDDREAAILAKFTAEQIMAAVELAEAEYDYDLAWRAKLAAEKVVASTLDPVAWKAARKEIVDGDEARVAKHARLFTARIRWAEVRPR